MRVRLLSLLLLACVAHLYNCLPAQAENRLTAKAELIRLLNRLEKIQDDSHSRKKIENEKDADVYRGEARRSEVGKEPAKHTEVKAETEQHDEDARKQHSDKQKESKKQQTVDQKLTQLETDLIRQLHLLDQRPSEKKNANNRQQNEVISSDVRVEPCSATPVQISSTSGTIKSPGYDIGTYPNNAFCQWRITAPTGSVISARFDELAIEAVSFCIFDSVTLYDGSSRHSRKLGSFCSSDTAAVSVTSSASAMLVVFQSDSNVNTGRFSLSWTFVVDDDGGPGTSTSGTTTPTTTTSATTTPGTSASRKSSQTTTAKSATTWSSVNTISTDTSTTTTTATTSTTPSSTSTSGTTTPTTTTSATTTPGSTSTSITTTRTTTTEATTTPSSTSTSSTTRRTTTTEATTTPSSTSASSTSTQSTDTKADTTASSVTTTYVAPPDETCGRPAVEPSMSQARIVGGVEAARNSWPWQCLINVRFSGYYYTWCGATVVSDRYLLTAAHCLYDDYHDRIRDDAILISCGIHNSLRQSGRGVQKFRGVTSILHENFSPRGKDWDIAVIRLRSRLTVNHYVQPVCLPSTAVDAGTDCVATGWGETKNTGDNSVLRQVVVPVMAWTTCKQINSNMRRSFTRNMLCAGYSGGRKDTCQGDSGGPLVCKRGERWYQYGVISWGTGCGRANRPGVYSDVVKFLPWINAKIGTATRSVDNDAETTLAPLARLDEQSHIEKELLVLLAKELSDVQ